MDAAKVLLTILLACCGVGLLYLAGGVLLALALDTTPGTGVLALWVLTCVALYFGGKP